MGPADALSRKDNIETDDDNREITMLKGKDQYFHIQAIDIALAEKISSLTTQDPIVTKALATMNHESGEPWIPHTTAADWEFINNSLYFKHRLYVPEPAHHDLVRSLHDSPTRGHEGFFHTLHRMQKDYWWPGMSTILRKYVSGSAECQAAKVNTHPTIPGLSPLAVEHPLPFSSISVDLITGLPDSHGYDSVMVVVDHGLTKGVIYCPCTKTIDSKGVAQLFFTNVFPRFGLHSKIISDRGPQFASAFARELAHLLQYDVALSTAYCYSSFSSSFRPTILSYQLSTYLER